MAPFEPLRHPLPERIPVLPIRSTIVFPGGATALQIGFAPNVEALTRHPEHDLIVAMVSTDDDGFPLDPRPLEKVATAVRVLDRLNLPGGTIQTTRCRELRRISLSDVRLEDALTAVPVGGGAPRPAAEADRCGEDLGTLTAVARAGSESPTSPHHEHDWATPGASDLTAALCNLKLVRDAVMQEAA